MATLYDQVQSVYTGADTTSPYASLVSELADLKTKVQGSEDLFSGQPADVDPYKDAIDALADDIQSLIDSIEFHDKQWWNHKFASQQSAYGNNNQYLSYKDIPSILSNGDKIVQEVREESGMAPLAEDQTYYYKGTQTWSDSAGLLSGWVAEVIALKADIDGIQGGSLTNGKAVVAATKANIGTIQGAWTTAKGEEYTNWDEAIKYMQAYSYITFLETGAADPDIQELKGKFSGNLPELD